MVSYIVCGIIILEATFRTTLGEERIQAPHICHMLFVHSVPPQGKEHFILLLLPLLVVFSVYVYIYLY